MIWASGFPPIRSNEMFSIPKSEIRFLEEMMLKIEVIARDK